MGSRMSRGIVSGPLAPFAAGYEQWLVDQGFRPGSVADRLSQLRHLNGWLGAEGLSVEALDSSRVECVEFGNGRNHCKGYPRRPAKAMATSDSWMSKYCGPLISASGT